MRIIGGKYKGLKLLSPDSTNTRPTSDKLKESLFSIITSNKYFKVKNFKLEYLFYSIFYTDVKPLTE